MTQARENQISLDDTSFYHCYVRCVRRAFLYGTDKLTGNNYDHRKQWLVSRIRFLSYIYAIDICAYAVMSNHYHVVLHVDQQRAENWTDDEVVERWLQLYKGNFLIQRWQNNRDALSKAELAVIADIIQDWRGRLRSISCIQNIGQFRDLINFNYNNVVISGKRPFVRLQTLRVS